MTIFPMMLIKGQQMPCRQPCDPFDVHREAIFLMILIRNKKVEVTEVKVFLVEITV